MTAHCVWGVLTVWRVRNPNLTQLQTTLLKAFGISVSGVAGFSHMWACVDAQSVKG
jgi:hypothetical protein